MCDVFQIFIKRLYKIKCLVQKRLQEAAGDQRPTGAEMAADSAITAPG